MICVLHGESPEIEVRMSAKGAGEVTAGDIEAPADLEILNPELVLANLSDKGRLDMTLTIGRGRGYAPNELQHGRRRRRSVSFRSTRSSRRFAASRTTSKRRASVSAPTTTSCAST